MTSFTTNVDGEIIYANDINELQISLEQRAFNVKDPAFGATGNGVDDDTDAIQAAIDAAGVNGTVLFPNPSAHYVITQSLVPLSGQTWVGPGAADPATLPTIRSSGLADAIVKATSTVSFFTMRGMNLRGTGVSGNKGVYATDARHWRIEDCSFDLFGDHAVQITGGVAGHFQRLVAQNCMAVTSGRSAYVGVFDLAQSDPFVSEIEMTASSAAVGSGWIAGIVVRGNNGFWERCVGEISQTGIVVLGGLNRLSDCRADLNRGHGFVLAGNGNDLVGCLALSNSRETTNTYDGFVTSSSQNNFTSCRVDDLYGFTRHAFSDSGSTGSPTEDTLGNSYHGCRARNITGSHYNFTGWDARGAAGLIGRDFQIGAAADDGGHDVGHLRLGNYHLWVDSTGDLRIKSSAPSSDLDGVTVGSQT